MNRLSTDIGTLDQVCYKSRRPKTELTHDFATQSVSAGLLYSTLELFATVGVVIAIAIALPRFLIVGIFILLAYIPLGWAFVASGRDLTRVGERSSQSTGPNPRLLSFLQSLCPEPPTTL